MKKLLVISFGTSLLSIISMTHAKSDQLRHNSFSVHPTSNSRSKTPFYKNNAWMMSEDTETSLYSNLGKAAGLQESEVNSLRLGDKRAKKNLTELFGTSKAVCKVTIKPDGQVQNIIIKESTGSVDTDQRILDFVKSAAPFRPNKFPKALSWAVEIPGFIIKPDWFDDLANSTTPGNER